MHRSYGVDDLEACVWDFVPSRNSCIIIDLVLGVTVEG